MIKNSLAFLCLFVWGIQLSAQPKLSAEIPSPIFFIYDASGSMWGQINGKTKMEIASDVLSEAVANLSETQAIGLVAYGHRQKGDCNDVEFLLDIHTSSKTQVGKVLNGIKPLGKTPLARSAEMVIDRLRSSKQKATIILITDGIESCDGDLCKVTTNAKKEGIDFKLHIVGFGLKESETAQLRCAAKAGEGTYYDAANADGLSNVLNEATSTTVDSPTPNFSLYATKNGEAVDVLFKAYDKIAKRKPIGKRTYRDTAAIYLPPGTYSIEVSPLENTRIMPLILDNIVIEEETTNLHKTVRFDGGKFLVSTSNNGEGWDATVKVTDSTGKVVGGSRTYGRTREIELNAGTYTLQIQALRMKGLQTNVTVEKQLLVAGESTIVKHDFKTGVIEILPRLGDELIDCTTKFVDVATGKTVAGGRTYAKGISYVINPGVYEVEVNPLAKTGASGKKSVKITIKEGETISKIVQF